MSSRLVERGRATLVSSLVAVMIAASLPLATAAYVDPAATVWINEIHYDDDSTDSGEAVEIAGPAGTSLAGYSIELYNGNGGARYDVDPLSGTIPDQQNGFGTVVLSYPVNGIQNGSPDGVALVNGTTVLQFLSYENTFTATSHTANGLSSTDIGVAEAADSPDGFSLQLTGNGTSYGDFSWAGSQPNTMGAVNAGQSFGPPPEDQPVALSCGGTLTLAEGGTATRTVSATDPDDQVVVIEITGVTPDPAPGSISRTAFSASTTDGAPATATISASGLAPGTYTVSIEAANDDATPQTASCAFTVEVLPVLHIGTVQGPTTDAESGPTDRSPYAPAIGNATGPAVIVRGLVSELVLSKTSGGAANYGFFLQEPAGATDGDPLTSDGIFVFTGGEQTFGGYTPAVGDEIVLHGRVSEFFFLTELSGVSLIQLVRQGVDVDAALPVFEAQPPDSLADAGRYWERREGMRARIAAGSVVQNGRTVFPSTMDGEVWLIHPDHPVAQRTAPYTNRVFRDPHPLDDQPALFDNGNGFRVVLGSLGIKAAAGDRDALIAPSRTFDAVTNSPAGGVYFSFNKYQIQIDEQLGLAPGLDPAGNAPPADYDRQVEYSTATYNVENLYDFRDDPFDGCDFVGNTGCPGVNPPFDYVPASDADYQARLDLIAEQIVDVLHAPDLLMVQEAEDQDICTTTSTALICGTTDDRDGKPDTLQELALAIVEADGPRYEAVYDRDGADDRGIVAAFLYRVDRVTLVAPVASDPVLGSSPAVEYRGAPLAFNTDVSNPKTLNADLPSDVDLSTGVDGSNVFTRPPQVGHFRVWRDGIEETVFTDLWALSDHFSSTPNARVGQRTEQAAYATAIYEAIRSADADARVVVAGDFNVYPRPDDPFAPDQPYGDDDEGPSDQLGPLYDAGLTNLWDILVAQVPAAAYSYVFDGQAQTLDSHFASPALLDELVRYRVAHVNADFPGEYAADGARGLSDHDPGAARWQAEVTVDRLADLVRYYAASGRITGVRTEKLLLDRLSRAEDALDDGRMGAYHSQLEAFIDQVEDLTPRFIDPTASEVLRSEAARLLA